MAPKRKSSGTHITLRADSRVAERAEALIDFVTEISGRTSVASDVYREALMRGLMSLEKQQAAKE